MKSRCKSLSYMLLVICTSCGKEEEGEEGKEEEEGEKGDEKGGEGE